MNNRSCREEEQKPMYISRYALWKNWETTLILSYPITCPPIYLPLMISAAFSATAYTVACR